MTRAEAVKTVVSFAGRKPAKIGTTYKDVESNAWYAPYVYAAEDFLPVAWKVSRRIEPEAAVTREELVYMIVYAMGYDSELKFANRFLVDNAFSDNASVSETLKSLFSLAVSNDAVYHRSQYTKYYKKYVEDYNFYNKRLEETIVSDEVGSARVCVNNKDDWYYEIISDADMYE